MSIILGNYSKKEKKTSKISIDGYIQTLPPDNDLPTSWTKRENLIYLDGMRTGDITEWVNEEGNRTHFTWRKKDKDGNKKLIPFTYWSRTQDGEIIGVWKTKGWLGKKCFHKSNKIQDSELPLLVAEGEKCMHFAEKDPFLSKHYLPTTWWGGVEQLPDYNYEIFKDKEVILCPDNDGPGRKAMHFIAYQLVTKGITTKIKYFNLAEKFKESFPTAWDIADEFPKNYKLENVLEPGSMFITDFSSIKEDQLWKEIEDDEVKRTEKEVAKNISNSLCYVMANDMFNRLGTADFYQAKQLNNYHKHQVKKGTLTDILLKDPEFDKAETFITSAKFKPGLVNITKPGMIPLIRQGVVLNIYIPNHLTEKQGDVKFLIDFFIWLVGEKKWRIIEQWIAYLLQYPGEKIKWAIVLVSAIEGVGKGLLARILSRVLGIENVNENANYKHLTNTHNTLLVRTQVIVLNEVSLGDFKSKAEGTNTLKNFVADDYYSCNFKNKPMVKLPNLTCFLLCSNDVRVINANQGIRRYFFCNIDKTEEEIIQKTDEGFFKRSWDFVDSDEGARALIHYFKREVNIPNPDIFKARAPITEDLKILIEETKHPVIKKLEWDLTRPDDIHRKIFHSSWSGLMTFDELNENMSTTRDTYDHSRYDWGSYGDDALYKFLSANCTRWNNGETTRQISISGVKHRFYLLDDTRCPMPGKSYKDLNPKDIETIYKNYRAILDTIKEEKPSYETAKFNIEGYKKNFKRRIESWIDRANKEETPKFYGDYKNKTVDQVWEEIANGNIKLIEKGPLDDLSLILSSQKIIKRGIRTPWQILAELGGYTTKLNGASMEPKKKLEDEEIHKDYMKLRKPTSLDL